MGRLIFVIVQKVLLNFISVFYFLFIFLLAAQVLLKIKVSVEPCLVNVVVLMRCCSGTGEYEAGREKTQYTLQKTRLHPVPILDFRGPYAKLCRGGERMDATNAFVHVSLHLESRSRKALEKQYLFRSSVHVQLFCFCLEQETVRHSRYMIWQIFT